MEAIHEEKRNGLTIKIIPDDSPNSPDEGGDDSLFLSASHRQFTVKAPNTMRPRSCYWIFGLEAYIHSGVRLALAYEGRFPDRQWDVSLLGEVFVCRTYWKTKDKARKAALSLINEWNDYLSGNCYGYRVENAAGEDLGSVWGFSGDYDAEGGALSEARSVVDHLTNKGVTDEKGQYLMAFMAEAT